MNSIKINTSTELPLNFTGVAEFNMLKRWYVNGKQHREDGSAVEYADGTKQWWLNGNFEGSNLVNLSNVIILEKFSIKHLNACKFIDIDGLYIGREVLWGTIQKNVPDYWFKNIWIRYEKVG